MPVQQTLDRLTHLPSLIYMTLFKRQNYRDRNQIKGYQAGLGKIKLKKIPALETFQDDVNVFSYDRCLYKVAQLLEHSTDDHEGSSLYRACLESTEPWVQSQCTCLYNPITLVGKKESEIQNHYQLHSEFKASLAYLKPFPKTKCTHMLNRPSDLEEVGEMLRCKMFPAHMRYWIQPQDTHTYIHTTMNPNTCKLHQIFPQTATNLAEMLY